MSASLLIGIEQENIWFHAWLTPASGPVVRRQGLQRSFCLFLMFSALLCFRIQSAAQLLLLLLLLTTVIGSIPVIMLQG